MSLFVRLEVGFWTHRKTIRLRALIGDAALWLPPRLWSYAAQNQPDGDFTGYLANELAMLLGYDGDAQAMLEALQRASFMDGMKIHGWADHNGYHTVFAERAKKAARARWRQEKTGEEKRREESTRQEASNASSMLQAFTEFWNAYPRRVGKADAEKAWKKNGCDKILPQILVSLRTCKTSSDWTKEAGQFIPHPATWLNRRGWEDELLPQRSNGIRENIKPKIIHSDDL